MPWIQAVRQRVLSDAAIVALLGTYEFTTGVPAPAFFSAFKIPDDSAYPAIIAKQILSNPNFGCRDKRGSEVVVDLRMYDDKTFSSDRLRDLAEKVWKRMHRGDLTSYLAPLGYEDWGCFADPPMDLVDIDGFPGLLVSCRLRTLET